MACVGGCCLRKWPIPYQAWLALRGYGQKRCSRGEHGRGDGAAPGARDVFFAAIVTPGLTALRVR